MDDPKRFYIVRPLTSNLTIKYALFWISLLILVGLGSVAILLVKGGWWREAIGLAIGMLPIIFAFELNRRNNAQLAGSLIAVTLTLAITALATIGEGIYDIGVMAYPAILLTAALVLRRNTTIYLTIFMLASIGWLIFGDLYGLYQPLYPSRSLAFDFVIASIILIITATAVHILSDAIRGNVNSIQHELEERKKVEHALREAEELYRNMVEETSVITYRDKAEKESPNIYISPQIKNFLGYAQAEWHENPKLWLELTHPDDLPGLLTLIEKYRGSDSHW